MDVFDSFPEQIRANSGPDAQTYTLLPGLYAIHGKSGLAAPDAAYLFNDGAIAVSKGSPDQTTVAAARDKLSPVYTLVPGGSPAVPTGLVFIRFAEESPVVKLKDKIEGAGYEIAESLAYAPNAAWLRARSGKIEDALAGLKALEKLPDVESVEPQMLMESARR